MDEANKQLIVNYLPQGLCDEEFADIFKQFAPVVYTRVMRDKKTNYSFGYGFVELRTREQCETAIKTITGTKVMHKNIKVSYSQKKGGGSQPCNLYVSGFGADTKEEQVVQLFDKFGKMTKCNLVHSVPGKTEAFVSFETRECGEAAMVAMQNFNFKMKNGSSSKLFITFAKDALETKHFQDFVKNQKQQEAGYENYQEGVYSPIGGPGQFGGPPPGIHDRIMHGRVMRARAMRARLMRGRVMQGVAMRGAATMMRARAMHASAMRSRLLTGGVAGPIRGPPLGSVQRFDPMSRPQTVMEGAARGAGRDTRGAIAMRGLRGAMRGASHAAVRGASVGMRGGSFLHQNATTQQGLVMQEDGLGYESLDSVQGFSAVEENEDYGSRDVKDYGLAYTGGEGQVEDTYEKQADAMYGAAQDYRNNLEGYGQEEATFDYGVHTGNANAPQRGGAVSRGHDMSRGGLGQGGNAMQRGSMAQRGGPMQRGCMAQGGNAAPRGGMPQQGGNTMPRGGMGPGGNVMPRGGAVQQGGNSMQRGGMPQRAGHMQHGGMTRGGMQHGGMNPGGPHMQHGGMNTGGASASACQVCERGEDHVVYVYGIGTEATETDLYKLFASLGRIVQVNTGGKGFAFVHMGSFDEANDAIQTLDGNYFEKSKTYLQVRLKNA